MKTKQYSSKRGLAMWGSLIAAAIMLLGNYHKAQAQWTTAQNGNDVYKTNTAGNVGIGTTAPGEKLDVTGAGVSIGGTGAVNTAFLQDHTNYRGIYLGHDTANQVGIIAASTPSAASSLAFWTYSGSAWAEKMRIDGAGNVGIGKTSPVYKLDVNGSLGLSGGSAVFKGDGASTGGNLQLWKDTSPTKASNVGMAVPGSSLTDDLIFSRYTGSAWLESLRVQNSTGNVGIGTTSPGTFFGGIAGSGRVLHIANSADHAQLFISASGAGKLATVTMEVGDASATKRAFQTRYEGATNAVKSFFFNEATGAVTQDNVLVLKNDGNVGIGTPSPTSKLHVVGDGNVTGNLTVGGNIAAKYQDVAEWVPSSEQIPAGTVVVLDVTKSNQVVRSTESYDTRVAGVVSAQPGIALGESGTGKVLVATTGRVLVKVDATKGPIHIGDLLVTSDVPGVAMKSEPVDLGGVQIHRPGTLIGKALEPLEKGSGKVLVLLSLQ